MALVLRLQSLSLEAMKGFGVYSCTEEIQWALRPELEDMPGVFEYMYVLTNIIGELVRTRNRLVLRKWNSSRWGLRRTLLSCF